MNKCAQWSAEAESEAKKNGGKGIGRKYDTFVMQ